MCVRHLGILCVLSAVRCFVCVCFPSVAYFRVFFVRHGAVSELFRRGRVILSTKRCGFLLFSSPWCACSLSLRLVPHQWFRALSLLLYALPNDGCNSCCVVGEARSLLCASLCLRTSGRLATSTTWTCLCISSSVFNGFLYRNIWKCPLLPTSCLSLAIWAIFYRHRRIVGLVFRYLPFCTNGGNFHSRLLTPRFRHLSSCTYWCNFLSHRQPLNFISNITFSGPTFDAVMTTVTYRSARTARDTRMYEGQTRSVVAPTTTSSRNTSCTIALLARRCPFLVFAHFFAPTFTLLYKASCATLSTVFFHVCIIRRTIDVSASPCF